MREPYYVTVTWDNWPEGGSFGTIVEAESFQEAEDLCFREMVDCREDDDPDYFDEAWKGEWHVVDCFTLRSFIRNNKEFIKPEWLNDA